MPRSKKQTEVAPAQESAAPLHDTLYLPRDPQTDHLLTTLLRAGEQLAETALGNASFAVEVSPAAPEGDASVPRFDGFDGLRGLLEQIQTLSAQAPHLAEQIARLPAAFGDGYALCLLFRNLFPGRSASPVPGKDGKPLLTSREVDVLRRMAGDWPQEEIAGSLGITRLTVKKHVDHIYRKLGVHRPMQAVARAAALGYLNFDTVGHVVNTARAYSCGVNPFLAFCAEVGVWTLEQGLAGMEPLAAFGLLLLLLSGAAGRQIEGDSQPVLPGGVCLVNAQGKVMRTLRAEGMGVARSLVVIPPHAAARGFTSGNLLVAHDFKPQQDLNRAVITEFTPSGHLERRFCGGSEISTRLIGPLSLAFAADGRLLATSGWLTDAILAFDAGGATVSRFADGAYHQVFVGAAGRVYAAPCNPISNTVRVLDSCGQLVEVIPTLARDILYDALAVDSQGRLFLARDRTPNTRREREVMDVYAANGTFLHSFGVPGLSGGRLTMDAEDHMVIPCPMTSDVKVYSPDGALLRRIDLQDKLYPHAVAPGENGRLWIGGRLP